MESLKSLYEQGYLTREDFEERKNQVIDELTGTKAGSKSRSAKANELEDDLSNGDGQEEGKAEGKKEAKEEGNDGESPPPPDFSSIQPEKAIKHVCHHFI